MIVVALGNAFDGLSLVGPFPDRETALLYCEGDDTDWHIIEMDPPPAEFSGEEDDEDGDEPVTELRDIIAWLTSDDRKINGVAYDTASIASRLREVADAIEHAEELDR